jgi:multiple antibiotic resistance protein
VIGPFVKITMNADKKLRRQIAFRATLYSSIALLLASVLGGKILSNYGIPVPILSLSGGIILFLVALLNIIQQFSPTPTHDADTAIPTMAVAMNPLAFPTIVTPYGIAAVIVFMALFPDLESKLTVGGIVVGIMALNLLVMLISHKAYKVLAVILPILSAVLGVVQVALGLLIIYNQTKALIAL